MTINAQGYFDKLKGYLSDGYFADEGLKDSITLSEKIFSETGTKKIKINVSLPFKGDAFAIKLDNDNNPLFHFLDNNGKPWSKRCDFVVFQCYRNCISAHCIEFKYGSLPVDKVIMQLSASVSWCKTLNALMDNYTGQKKRFKVFKYVFTKHDDPSRFLDPNNEYLNKDRSIRHYHYDDVRGIAIEDLDHRSHVTV